MFASQFWVPGNCELVVLAKPALFDGDLAHLYTHGSSLTYYLFTRRQPIVRHSLRKECSDRSAYSGKLLASLDALLSFSLHSRIILATPSSKWKIEYLSIEVLISLT